MSAPERARPVVEQSAELDARMLALLASGEEPDPNTRLGALLLAWLAEIEDGGWTA